MSKKIVIMGAGPGGYIAAIRAAQIGAEVTLIEQENVGGTCLNWGCIPTKIMKTTAEMLSIFKRSKDFGIILEGPVVPDMELLMARKRKVVKYQTDGILHILGRHNVRILKGTGYVKGPGVVFVRFHGGGNMEVPWDKLILATGSREKSIPLFPFDGERILSSRHAVDLTMIPEKLLIVGGGVVGCEFAFIFSSLGSQVTIVEAMDRLLPLKSVDADCSKVIQREMKKRKIRFFLNATLEGLEDSEGKSFALIHSESGKASSNKSLESFRVEADKVLISVGREPISTTFVEEGIPLKKGKGGWVFADDRMRTSVPDIYAVGDMLGPSRPMLAHVASAEGMVAAENAMGGIRIMEYGAVPEAIFTTPEIANVGLTEIEAEEKGYDTRSDSVLFRNLGKAHVIGQIEGQAKIVSEIGSGKILGVHITGPNATDLIAEGVVALRAGLTVEDLALTIHAHPTLSEVIWEVSNKGADRTVHG